MTVYRKEPLAIEAIQFNAESDIKEILLLQSRAMNSRIIRKVWDSLYVGGRKIQKTDWVVKEGDFISAYSNNEFNTLFKKEVLKFAIPTLVDTA